MQENRAMFELEEGQTEASQDVFKQNKNIAWINAEADNDKAEADIIVTDEAGMRLKEIKGVKFSNKRYGERLNLPLTHNYCKILLENVKNAKTVNVFVE